MTPGLLDNAIGFWQRGFGEKRDRQDLISCLKTAVDDFKHGSLKFYSLFIDFKDAFGSLKHSYMIRCLLEAGVPKPSCEIIADIYSDSHIEVICGNETTKEFQWTSGGKTGDPGSPILFIVALDKILFKVVQVANPRATPHEIRSSPIPVSAFADDVLSVSLTERIFNSMSRTLKEEIQDTGLVIQLDKCGVFYERYSGNRWYKAKSDRLPSIEFNNENVKVLKRDKPYVYLGKPMTVAEETQDEVNQMLDDYHEFLVLVAPVAIKLESNNPCQNKASFSEL